MKPVDFIYTQVKDGCIKNKVEISLAEELAEQARSMYLKQQFTGKPIDLVLSQIKKAKAITKGSKKK